MEVLNMKKALLVGINYPNTEYSLNGCVNDVMAMSDMLAKYGFKPQNKRMLTNESATTDNILERLNWLVDDATPGDVLFFHYSGHGSQVIDQTYDNDKEPDGKDEIICPIDLDWRTKIIRDDDMRRIFDKVPDGVNLTVVLDCCHSGGGIDSQVQYETFGRAKIHKQIDPTKGITISKELPMPADIANRGIGANLNVKPRGIKNNKDKDVGLLISGCQSQQTSADSFIGNKFMGAATYFLIRNLQLANNDITYKTLVDNMNKELKEFGYDQRPELNGNKKLFENKFLDSFIEWMEY